MLVSDAAGGGFAIPMGWPKRNRTDAEAAALEAAEEAGAVGEVAPQPIGKFFYWKELAVGRVRIEAAVYPLRVQRLRARWKAEGATERVWVPAGEAAELVRDPDLAALIEGL
ncbi:NUDIX hydrolase (plasmid) [Gemmobacter aquarius]|uniref:NUDIX hydrolase n=1 Tax=Paragemmobacter aquarius TaxID=2169400 RepID=A0A2S0US54_9RHOB|nr:NUDIX hydrolase [Gemmobacter aquarius]